MGIYRWIAWMRWINSMKIQENIYDSLIMASYVLILLSNLGVSAYAPIYLKDLNYIYTIYISAVLLWRFNPLRKDVKFTNLDKKISFSAGFFILFTNVIGGYVSYYSDYFTKLLHHNNNTDHLFTM